ncbi:hypothetical protein [Vulcanisaeta sp. JCM 14467]|uniref:hypothetical protein n=1 Tax=Vulcanisaeta sp. JCM 14467 TaxID=1295370 RepID=UPI0006D1FDFF|nr:hypothetical protein [Vulcanisaeta sp. JCM 14467]
MRYRSVSIREDVYRRLEGFASMRGLSMSDAIAELLSEHQSLSEIKELLRQCLDKLGKQTTTTLTSQQPINTHGSARESGETTEAPLIGFEDNPWVQIIRARVVGGEGGEGR